MKKSQMFPSKYLKAEDFEDSDQTLTIREVAEEDVGMPGKAEKKAIVYFEEVEKGLVLNKTNWSTIEQLTGQDDTDNWVGHRITLGSAEVTFQGEVMLSIRVRLKKPASKVAAPAKANGAAAELEAVKKEAVAALKAKHPGETKERYVELLNGYIGEFYEGQAAATLGIAQWRELITADFDTDKLAIARAGGIDGDDLPI